MTEIEAFPTKSTPKVVSIKHPNVDEDDRPLTTEEEEDYEEQQQEEEEEEEEIPFVSVFEILDAPRDLPPPVQLTDEHIQQVATELGLITLCWPKLENVDFEGRTQFPESYLKNNDKEVLLLLYAENFRRQFHYKFPTRKQLFLACGNECGVQKMVCTTLCPTTLPYMEIESWENCASFVADQIVYEPLPIATLLPSRLYSPHTVCMRQLGQSFEIATVLCSLLIGQNYNAYVVSGYATCDVTMKIMTRVESPYKTEDDQMKDSKSQLKETQTEDNKYTLKPQKDLRSKFLLTMAQREIDKENAERERIAEIQRKLIEEAEKPPFDEIEGLRVHSWVLLLPGETDVKEPLFIEPSTGTAHPVSSNLYCGIESVWNHLNYWVNMQDCSQGLGKMKYDFTVTQDWEHLLPGEPLHMRQKAISESMYEEEGQMDDVLEEKHLDMPVAWSAKIDIPHDVLKARYPTGMKQTYYKRTLVEEFAPYVQTDGLVLKINRFEDMECTIGPTDVEERYENRRDHLIKIKNNLQTNWIEEHFERGREDGVKANCYYGHADTLEAERIIEFYHSARHDGLTKIELNHTYMTEYYTDREDLFHYRHIEYARRGEPPPGMIEGPRRIVVRITEKFFRNEKVPASKDIAVREFELIQREIHLKYHYDKGKVTASTRDFIKPPLAEMGESMRFNPELTVGYEAEIGAKPPRQLQLFLLFKEQLDEEEKALEHVRDLEDEISDFVHLREQERAYPVLDVSIYNREQNLETRRGMQERERQLRERREQEVEEDIDYLSPYFARLGNPQYVTREQALKIRDDCLADFRQLLLNRALDIQSQFDKNTSKMTEKQIWYVTVQDSLRVEEEEAYFREINALVFFLHTLDIRLNRHRELSSLRFEAVRRHVYNDPRLKMYLK